MASPEYHGAPRKWPTQITEYLALCYDLLHDKLTAEHRKIILDSIDWRLRATYFEKYSWRSGDTIARSGSAVFCQSHPFENFMWSLPGVLLTAGDLEVSDELTPLCLNYLTGVTSAHGPDEAWNEGLAYGSWKGQTMLSASMYTTLLLPELKLDREPVLPTLGAVVSALAAAGDPATVLRRLRGRPSTPRFDTPGRLSLLELVDRRRHIRPPLPRHHRAARPSGFPAALA